MMFFPSMSIFASTRPSAGRHRRRRPAPLPSQPWTNPGEAGSVAAPSTPSSNGGARRPTTIDANGVADYAQAGSTYFAASLSSHTLFLHGELDLSSRDLLTRAGNDFAANFRDADSRTTTAASSTATGTTTRGSTAITAVIDAAGLEFIDAAGLGALVVLHNTLAQAGMGLRTIHPSRQLRRISTICDLDEILGVTPADTTCCPRRELSKATPCPPGAGRAGPSRAPCVIDRPSQNAGATA